jgi:hypothetical protein
MKITVETLPGRYYFPKRSDPARLVSTGRALPRPAPPWHSHRSRAPPRLDWLLGVICAESRGWPAHRLSKQSLPGRRRRRGTADSARHHHTKKTPAICPCNRRRPGSRGTTRRCQTMRSRISRYDHCRRSSRYGRSSPLASGTCQSVETARSPRPRLAGTRPCRCTPPPTARTGRRTRGAGDHVGGGELAERADIHVAVGAVAAARPGALSSAAEADRTSWFLITMQI